MGKVVGELLDGQRWLVLSVSLSSPMNIYLPELNINTGVLDCVKRGARLSEAGYGIIEDPVC